MLNKSNGYSSLSKLMPMIAPKRPEKAKLPHPNDPPGTPFIGPDGKRYFRSASGHVYPIE